MSSPEAWQWHVVQQLVDAARMRVEPLLVPIGKHGVGDDLDASGEYGELCAWSEGTGRHGGADLWLPIVDRAAQLLLKRSKDLRLARIWSLASARMIGPEALLEGIVLLDALGARFPNGLHPWSDFDRAQSFSELVNGACWDVLGLGEDADLNQLLAIGLALDSLAARFGHVFQPPNPGFARLDDALRAARTRIVPSRSASSDSLPSCIVPSYGAPARQQDDHVGDFLRESKRTPIPVVTTIQSSVPETLHTVLRFPDAIELASRPMTRLAPYRMQLLLRPRVDAIGMLVAPVRVADVLAMRAPSVHFMIEVDGGLLQANGAGAATSFRSRALPLSSAWETPPLDLELVASASDFLGLRVSIWAGDHRLTIGGARLAIRPG